MNGILPSVICDVMATRLNSDKIYELRLRAGKPVTVNYGGKYYYLSDSGLTTDKGAAFELTFSEIKNIVVRATEFSLYSLNSRLSDGYITAGDGVRIGICGDVVSDGGKVKTIKNFSSLNVRFPHEVIGCAKPALQYMINESGQLLSTLICAPPGAGKTTLLRDVCRSISEMNRNVLLVDERNELAACVNGTARLDVGAFTDVIAGTDKAYAFGCGIRSMSPDVIITDELFGGADFSAVKSAAGAGVTVIASVHASDENELFTKDGFAEIYRNRCFLRYVFLSKRRGVGTYEKILDSGMNILFSAG